MKRRRLGLLFCLSISGIMSSCLLGSPTEGAFALGASARGLGLGGAFLALVDDETAAVHNPSALGQLAVFGFSSLYVQQFGGVTYGAMCLAMPGIGVSASLVDSGLIPSPQGSFRYTLYEFGIATGVSLGDVGIGARWRLFRQNAPTKGVGWSLDPALTLRIGIFRLGAVLESALSSPMTYASGKSQKISPSLNVGIAAVFKQSENRSWSIASELGGLLSGDLVFRIGSELWFGRFSIRAGYDGQGFTLGASVRADSLQLDWAHAVRTDLGTSHRVSLALRKRAGGR